MKIGIGEEQYEFDPDRFLNVELMAIEKATGYTAMEWQDRLNRGSMTAITALFWIMRKRHTNPAAKFDDVEFDSADLDIDFRTDEEVAAAEKAAAEEAAATDPDSASQSTTPDDSSPTPTTTTSSPSSTGGA